jgi:cytochrome bd ubiquinol oxidase subunit II
MRIAALAVVVWEWRALTGSADAAPFIAAVRLFLPTYLGIAISLWPMIVPYYFTL